MILKLIWYTCRFLFKSLSYKYKNDNELQNNMQVFKL